MLIVILERKCKSPENKEMGFLYLDFFLIYRLYFSEYSKVCRKREEKVE